jgi:hypothetical protein
MRKSMLTLFESLFKTSGKHIGDHHRSRLHVITEMDKIYGKKGNMYAKQCKIKEDFQNVRAVPMATYAKAHADHNETERLKRIESCMACDVKTVRHKRPAVLQELIKKITDVVEKERIDNQNMLAKAKDVYMSEQNDWVQGKSKALLKTVHKIVDADLGISDEQKNAVYTHILSLVPVFQNDATLNGVFTSWLLDVKNQLADSLTNVERLSGDIDTLRTHIVDNIYERAQYTESPQK